MRTFIAIGLDPAIQKTMADFLRRLRKINSRNVTWVRDEAMHLTLKFLGNVDESRAAAVKSVLAEITKSVSPFPLALKGTGHFPLNPRSIRVLWIGAFEQPTLMALQREIDFRLQPLGFAAESAPFHPHLTLGRIKSPGKLNDVLNEMERYKFSDFGQMTVATITLFESKLKPTGAEHSVLAEFSLS